MARFLLELTISCSLIIKIFFNSNLLKYVEDWVNVGLIEYELREPEFLVFLEDLIMN